MKSNDIQKLDPAAAVIALFSTPTESGAAVIAEFLGLSYSSVYRWQLPKAHNGGLGGYVPGRHYNGLRELAAQRNIDLPWEMLTGALVERRKAHG
jgi:hypothetical protein